MNNSSRTTILFRYSIISIFILVLAGLIVHKMFKTTVIDAEKWNIKAQEDFSRIDTILPVRGDILACDGSILATNLRYYTIRLDYRTERFKEDSLRKLMPALADSMAKYHPQRSAAQWSQYILEPLAKEKAERTRSKKIVSNITFSEYERLRTFPFFNFKNRNMNGLVVERNIRRSNPYGQMAKRSIGGVGEQERNEIHGVSGLEMALDSLLFGIPGTAKRITLTDRVGRQTDVAAVKGYDIVTTIDVQMQDIVENELNRMLDTVQADWGVAVLMEVATGEIKAISNLERSESGDYIEGMNRAVLGFEPGSVVKPISMLLALEDGLVNDIDKVYEIGSKYPYAGGKPITDSHYNGSLTVKGIIEQSSNIGMTKVLAAPGTPYYQNPGRFHDRLAELGFLDQFNMGIAGERIPNIAANPSRISLSRMCFGYATEIPPIYTLAVYNAIANKGWFVRPHLVKELLGEDFDSIVPITYMREKPICSEVNASKLTEMLTAVVWGDRGTARHFVRDDNVRIAGKTGTSYMVGKGGYDTSKKRLTFCGFFPAENPKYSCIVLTCYPKRYFLGAPGTSGRTVKNIAAKLYSRGLLDNSSDYNSDVQSSGAPTFYASHKANAHKNVKKGLHIKNSRELAPSAQVKANNGEVPQVMGLGIREAVVLLEEAGFNVAFTGSGYVKKQTPAAGTVMKSGEKVLLALTEF